MVHGVLHFESLVKCQFYAIGLNDASSCDSTSVGFLNCIENLKNSSLLQNCEKYVYEDEFMTKFGIYSGFFEKFLSESVLQMTIFSNMESCHGVWIIL